MLEEVNVDNNIKTTAAAQILDDLTHVGGPCMFGDKMFSGACSEAQFAMVSSNFAHVLQQLDALPLVIAEAIKQNRATFSNEVWLLGKSIAEAFKPKDKHLKYLGVDFTMPLTRITGEYELRVAANLRPVARSSGTLGPLRCEMQLAAPGAAASSVHVVYPLVQQSSACRSACVDFMEGKGITGESVKNLSPTKFNFLRHLGN